MIISTHYWAEKETNIKHKFAVIHHSFSAFILSVSYHHHHPKMHWVNKNTGHAEVTFVINRQVIRYLAFSDNKLRSTRTSSWRSNCSPGFQLVGHWTTLTKSLLNIPHPSCSCWQQLHLLKQYIKGLDDEGRITSLWGKNSHLHLY